MAMVLVAAEMMQSIKIERRYAYKCMNIYTHLLIIRHQWLMIAVIIVLSVGTAHHTHTHALIYRKIYS